MHFQHNDGGRAAAGFDGRTGDCVVRAVAIATELSYADVYAALTRTNEACRARNKKSNSVRHGVWICTAFKRYMQSLGWRWVATMGIGTGCKVHLRADELPAGRLICSVSRHYVAIVDGVIQDTHDPSREGKRCVYGYWIKLPEPNTLP